MVHPRIIDPAHLADEFLAEWHSRDPYITAHTSGSTGAPKPIRLLKTDMEASALATCARFNIAGDSLLYMPLSPAYIAGKMMIVRALVSGATLQVATPSVNPLPVAPVGRVSLLPIVPSQADALLSSGHVAMVDRIIVGGAPMSPETERRLMALDAEVYATYGMTETCSHVALRQLGDATFEAMPGIRFDTDSRGCLVIDAPGFSFGRLTTNDVVDLADPTHFRWLGRADNAINSGGIKIFPEEIERRIATLFPIAAAFFVGSRPSQQWGEELILVVENSPALPSDDYLMQQMRSLLTPKLAPKAIVRVESIPRTASGKIIRHSTVVKSE